MARKGDQARVDVMNHIVSAFPDSFIQDKKIYVTANEGGEAIQFAISLTMPKTPVAGPAGGVDVDAAGNHDFSGPVAKPVTPTATEISAEDAAKVDALMRKLGIAD